MNRIIKLIILILFTCMSVDFDTFMVFSLSSGWLQESRYMQEHYRHGQQVMSVMVGVSCSGYSRKTTQHNWHCGNSCSCWVAAALYRSVT